MKAIKTATMLALAAAMALAGCRSQRPSGQPAATSATSATVRAETAPGQWHDLYVPVKVRLSSPMTMSLSGRATMVRDSVINMSLRVLGMEMAVANVTADSVMLVDKYHSVVFAESLGSLLGSHPMTVGEMQDLLLGTDIGEPREMTFGSGDREVTVAFGDFSDTPAGPMAGTVSVSVPWQRTSIDGQLVWDTAKAQWNTGRSVNFTPPAGYRTCNKDNILELLRTL